MQKFEGGMDNANFTLADLKDSRLLISCLLYYIISGHDCTEL